MSETEAGVLTPETVKAATDALWADKTIPAPEPVHPALAEPKRRFLAGETDVAGLLEDVKHAIEQGYQP